MYPISHVCPSAEWGEGRVVKGEGGSGEGERGKSEEGGRGESGEGGRGESEKGGRRGEGWRLYFACLSG